VQQWTCITFAVIKHRFQMPVDQYQFIVIDNLCEQLAQGCYLTAEQSGIEPATSESDVASSNRYIASPHHHRTCFIVIADFAVAFICFVMGFSSG